MVNNIQIIFYSTIVITIILFPALFYFFHLTGDTYMMKDYTYSEGVCLPGKNSWHVAHCTLASGGVDDSSEPRLCYFNRECFISFKEPKTFPIWFWLLTIVVIFVLAWTGPSPTNMKHWRTKIE